MRNWTIKEAVDTIREGTDFAGMKEIAAFNPVFFKAVCENDVAGVAALMGEKFTLRRLSREALDDVDENEDTETSVDEKATAPKSKKAPAKAVVDDKSLEDMTTKELIAECEARGVKVPKYGKNKTFYLEALAGADGADEVEDDEAEEENPYEGKNAMSLFKMCKERGIKAEPRQKAKVYIDLLTADDAAGDEDVEDEDDSWADEAEEEKKPTAKAPTKGAKEKAPAKSGKKAEPAADDEEWDI